MRRLLAASALFAVGLLAVTGAAQPPGLPVGDGKTAPPAGDKSVPPPKPAEKKAVAARPPETVDAQIEAALANDPDVRMARARIALAEAELAKSRQAVALKVTTLRSGIAAQRAALDSAAEQSAIVDRMLQSGRGGQVEVLAAREKAAAAQAKLAGLEAELKLLVGDGPKAVAPAPAAGAANFGGELAAYQAYLGGHGTSVQQSRLLAALMSLQPPGGKATACNVCHDARRDGDLLGANWHGCPGILQEVARPAPAAPKGPVSDRLRAALDKPVSLGAKDAKVTWEQAVEAFRKDAGLDVPVRAEVKVGPVVSLGETLPVGAWLQLFADGTPGTRLLVREYGVLVTTKDLAPPDGVSVFDFWKQKPAVAKPAFKATFRQGGTTRELPGDGPVGDALRDLARATLDLAKTAKSTDPKSAGSHVERDHFQVVLPVAREFGLAGDGPAVLRVEAVDGPPPGGLVVYVTTDGTTHTRYADFPRDALTRAAEASAKAYAALAQAGVKLDGGK